MAEFKINNTDFANLKGQVVVITGCSSGIGLATTRLLLDIGASIVGGDLKATPVEHTNFTYVRTSVTSWTDLLALFRKATEVHKHIDHVFANAGIPSIETYLEDLTDEDDNPVEPKHLVLDVNLRGMINTCILATHYMRRQETGGSIVATASASSFQRFRAVDYATAKHGVLGFVRGMTSNLASQSLPIRINAIAPSWTDTGMISAGMIEAAGKRTQLPAAPARSVALLMADSSRRGQLIYSWEGKFKEVEAVLLKSAEEVLEGDISDDLVLERVYRMAAESGTQQGEK